MKLKLAHNKKISTSLLFGTAVLLLSSCASEPEVTPLPYCSYASHMSVNEQTREFIWRDKNHATFNVDWRESSLIEVANRYTYLERKDLPDAVKAQNDVKWLKAKLNDLLTINNNLLNEIEVNSCDNKQAPETPDGLKRQNEGINYIISGLAKISDDIATKKAKIVEKIEGQKS
ncbi:hypothetical protein [Thalassomonas sp. M1454]|uniref:hypothetical protein n=1 Tax=Thalassomonas sp. M1454 TaxID=2594477 RepID=UPI00117F74CB|nr:hypothetical protein [Thalassomonas sp. M1454]TRX55667.1 hypothetical protein FNN08_08515 [Thalassomonas sp. M1454]